MIAFLLFGIGILAFSLSGIQKGIDSENWPTAQGTIISSEVESYYDSDDHDYSYQPRVRYSYTVKGIDYFSEDISVFHSSYESSLSAQEIVDKYPAGKLVEVYYNPENPSESLLEPGENQIGFFILIIGFVFTILAFGLAILYLKIRRSGGHDLIKISIDKNEFNPGETIAGRIYLNLKEPEKARALKLRFIANKVVDQRDRNVHHVKHYPLHKEEIILDLEREYWNENYGFQIKIPINIHKKFDDWKNKYYSGLIGDILDKARDMGLVHIEERKEFYIEAKLDIPISIDLSNRYYLYIAEEK